MLSEPLQVVEKLTATFDALGIEYFVGGSVASSLHGAFRATNDVDIVAQIVPAQVPALVAALTADFYIDGDQINDALDSGSTFNIIYLPTMIKADVFVRTPDAFVDSEWNRRERLPLGIGAPSVFVASVEDMILQKLRWYRLTRERSDRQWGDIQGMLKLRRNSLDAAYLTEWGEHLQVADLLNRARAEAGL